MAPPKSKPVTGGAALTNKERKLANKVSHDKNPKVDGKTEGKTDDKQEKKPLPKK